MYRQGDVLIVPVAEEAVPVAHRGRARGAAGRPGAAGPRARRGHRPCPRGAGPGRLVREPGPFGPMFLQLPEGGRVVHEEHAAITLPKGWYRVVRQREYLPGAVRIVAD